MSKRILLIGHSGDMYGASRSLAKLVRILSKQHMVYVMLPQDGPLYDILKSLIPPERIFLNRNLYIFTRKSFRLTYLFSTLFQFLKNIGTIADIIRNQQIDIVHTNSGVVPSGALAAKLLGKKHLWHIREWFGDFKKFWPYYSAYITRFSDKVVCVSETMASQFKNKTNVISIYNGFPIPEIRDNNSTSTDLKNFLQGSDLILGCTSRIRLVRKGQEYLIEAIGILTKRTGKKIHLLVVGDYVPGYEYQKKIVEDLIQKFDLENRVHFLGHLEDPLPFYALFDIFVLPSGEPEPFGGVVMEAMSMGLPVIGSNLGGTTEQVKDGWNGYLFENRNPDDLAAKIELFLNDKEKLKQFGERSKERVEKLFSLQLHEKNILDLYNSL